MSYARVNEGSDLYIVRSSDKYRCYTCPIYNNPFDVNRTHIEMDTLNQLYNHLMTHVTLGHKVAQKTITRVSLELENETRP